MVSLKKPLYKKTFSGFTIVELLVVMAIFVFLSTMVMVKYPDSGSKLKVSNLTTDLDLDLHDLQLQASSVSSKKNTVAGYGIYFEGASPTKYVHIQDKPLGGQTSDLPNKGDTVWSSVDESSTEIKLPEGFRITDVCVSKNEEGTSTPPFTRCRSNHDFTDLTVMYERPDPYAIITVGNSTSTLYYAACIELSSERAFQPFASKGYQRHVIVTRMGLVSSSIGTCR